MKRLAMCLLLAVVCSLLMGRGVHATNYFPEDEKKGDKGIENEVDKKNDEAFPDTSPWLKDAIDKSIYSNAVDSSEEVQDVKVKSPGLVEKYFAELVRNAASSLIDLLQKNVGVTLDGIVYGRVGSGHPNKVNIFSFELRKGNPYGVTAGVAYSLIRGIVFVLLAVSFVLMLAKAAWSGQTARSREEIKGGVYVTAYKFAILTLMPYLLDVALYARDVVLYGIKEITEQMVAGGGTLSLSKAFLVNAERSGTFVDAAMYLGTVVLTLYFVFVYVSVAIDLLICFVGFPFLCLLHGRKRELLGNWTMAVLSDVLTPVVDAVLLLIPLLTSLMLSDVVKGVYVIQLVMCMLIIPARGRLKAMIGLQSGERNGFLGAMALLGLGRAAIGKIKKGVGQIGEIVSDARKSKAHGELSEIDRQEENELLSGFGGRTDEGARAVGGGLELGEADGLKGVGRSTEDEGDSEDQEENRRQAVTEPLGGEATGVEPLDGDGLEMEGLPPLQEKAEGTEEDGRHMEDATSERREGTPLAEADVAGGGDIDGEDGLEGGDGSSTKPRTRNEIIRGLEDEAEKKQENIDDLVAGKASLLEKDKSLQRNMLDLERGSDEYRAMERARADVGVKMAEADRKIAEEKRSLGALRGQARKLRSNGSHTGGAVPTRFDEKRAEVLLKRANIDNFEQPEYKDVLSNDKKRDLYRKRAIAKTGKLVADVGGTLAGGTLVGGASIFMQPSTVALATAGGAMVGGEMGAATVGLAIEANRVIRPIAKTASGSAASVVDAYAATLAGKAAKSLEFEKEWAAAPQASTPNPPIVETVGVSDGVKATGSETGESARTDNGTVERDVGLAMEKIISLDGRVRNSAGLRALERANVETEKIMASLRETEGSLNTETEREKRVEIQTEALTNEILNKLSINPDYEKGGSKYEEAKGFIVEKVRGIVEEKNRSMF